MRAATRTRRPPGAPDRERRYVMASPSVRSVRSVRRTRLRLAGGRAVALALLALLLAVGTAPATLRAQTAGSALPVTEFALPTGSRPGSIIAGPDGALWFTMPGGQCED